MAQDAIGWERKYDYMSKMLILKDKQKNVIIAFLFHVQL